jgi:hypothetical protein
VYDDVEDLEIRGLRVPALPEGEPVLGLRDVRDARIDGSPGGIR